MKSPLKQILEFIDPLTIDKTIPITSIFNVIRGQGTFCLLFFLTIPFLTPLQIPGLSTPFGIIMSILSFRKIFYSKIWIPKILTNKLIPSSSLKKILNVGFKIESFISRFLKPRLNYFFNNLYIRKINLFIIFICSLILALPIPIPLSNLFFAWIILIISIGHLMNDGLAILIGDSFFIIFLMSAIYLIF